MNQIIFNQLPQHFDSVLIVLFDNDRVLYIKNKKRAWELTGGKRDNDEPMIETAYREAYEEGGVLFNRDTFKAHGYYILPDGHTTIISSAQIETIEEIPESSESIDRQFLARPLEKSGLSFPDEIYDEVFDYLRWPHEQTL